MRTAIAESSGTEWGWGCCRSRCFFLSCSLAGRLPSSASMASCSRCCNAFRLRASSFRPSGRSSGRLTETACANKRKETGTASSTAPAAPERFRYPAVFRHLTALARNGFLSCGRTYRSRRKRNDLCRQTGTDPRPPIMCFPSGSVLAFFRCALCVECCIRSLVCASAACSSQEISAALFKVWRS